MGVYESALGRDLYHEHINGFLPILSTTTGILGTASVNTVTTLFTVPTSKNLILVGFVARSTSFTAGGGSINPAFYIGSSGTPNDFAGSQIVRFSAAATDKVYGNWFPSTLTPIYAGGTSIVLKITTQSDFTTNIFSLDLFGYFV